MIDISKRIKVLIIVILAMTLMCSYIEPVLAASSSLPEGAHLGNGMGTSRFGFRGPFMGMFGGPFGGMWEDMDEMDFGFMGMGAMGPYGFMNPWMMRGMGAGMGFGMREARERPR